MSEKKIFVSGGYESGEPHSAETPQDVYQYKAPQPVSYKTNKRQIKQAKTLRRAPVSPMHGVLNNAIRLPNGKLMKMKHAIKAGIVKIN